MMIDPQDYMTLARQCRQSGRLWEDSAFSASSKVLTDGNMIVSYFGRRQVAPLDFIIIIIIIISIIIIMAIIIISIIIINIMTIITITIRMANDQDDHVQVRDDEIQWLRPRDICKAMNLKVGPAMIVGERDR